MRRAFKFCFRYQYHYHLSLDRNENSFWKKNIVSKTSRHSGWTNDSLTLHYLEWVKSGFPLFSMKKLLMKSVGKFDMIFFFGTKGTHKSVFRHKSQYKEVAKSPAESESLKLNLVSISFHFFAARTHRVSIPANSCQWKEISHFTRARELSSERKKRFEVVEEIEERPKTFNLNICEYMFLVLSQAGKYRIEAHNTNSEDISFYDKKPVFMSTKHLLLMYLVIVTALHHHHFICK